MLCDEDSQVLIATLCQWDRLLLSHNTRVLLPLQSEKINPIALPQNHRCTPEVIEVQGCHRFQNGELLYQEF